MLPSFRGADFITDNIGSRIYQILHVVWGRIIKKEQNQQAKKTKETTQDTKVKPTQQVEVKPIQKVEVKPIVQTEIKEVKQTETKTFHQEKIEEHTFEKVKEPTFEKVEEHTFEKVEKIEKVTHQEQILQQEVVFEKEFTTASEKLEESVIEEVEVSSNLIEEIQQQKEKFLSDNILLNKKYSVMVQVEPLERMLVWQLFENFMEKKYTSDNQQMKAKKRQINMPDFMWNLIQEKYKGPGEAETFCARLCLALEKLYLEKHKYGTIFCRLLQVYHPDPMDIGVATFDVQTRHNFEKMLKVFIKKQQLLAEQNKISLTSVLDYNSEEFAEQGGYMPLIDVSDLVYSQFEKDRECGYRVMERLLPNNETKVEFTLFIVCWNMAKKRKQPKDLFKEMDKNKSGVIETNEFANGIKELLGVWLSTQEVKNIHVFMDADNTGDIEYEEFMERINYLTKKYKDKNAWLCSKADILTAIADEYDQKRYRDFEYLQKIFTESDSDGNGTLELFEFEDLCKKVDKSLDQTKVQKMFNEALKISKTKDPNAMTPQAFAVIAMKHNIGGFGNGIFNASNLMGLELEENQDLDIIEPKASI